MSPNDKMYYYTENIRATSAGQVKVARILGQLSQGRLMGHFTWNRRAASGIEAHRQVGVCSGRQCSYKIPSRFTEIRRTIQSLLRRQKKVCFKRFASPCTEGCSLGTLGPRHCLSFPASSSTSLCALRPSSLFQETSSLLSAHSTSGFTPVETHTVLCCSVSSETFPRAVRKV